jgi:TrpR-related protein YerC/YecD
MNPITNDEKNAIWTEIEQKSPELLDVFLALENKDEMKAFFRDLMSERDLREFAMRWEVAKMLDAGVTYEQIKEKTGAAMDTISKISRWLKEGCGGYKMMIERMKGEQE